MSEKIPEGRKHYQFHQNPECEFFPCHKTEKPEEFNCLFCYCPLYALGKDCGGNFKTTEYCAKDCSDCLLPHNPKGYEYIIEKYTALETIVKENM